MGEIHEGICRNHAGGHSLESKDFETEILLAHLKKDVINYARRCDKCQCFAKILRNPPTSLNPITSPWPFTVWGIDLIGELPKGKGVVIFAVVAMDYFTKWVEAEPLATITAQKIRNFVFRSIVCRFGIPYKLISDNDKQFDCNEMTTMCHELQIKKSFSMVCHPQSNGQTKAVNKILKETIKKKLEDAKGNWVEELPLAL